MKKRIEHYILNEPWEDRFERLVDTFQRRVIDPFLVFAALYIGYMAIIGFIGGE